jgi:hypothetical protein
VLQNIWAGAVSEDGLMGLLMMGRNQDQENSPGPLKRGPLAMRGALLRVTFIAKRAKYEDIFCQKYVGKTRKLCWTSASSAQVHPWLPAGCS